MRHRLVSSPIVRVLSALALSACTTSAAVRRGVDAPPLTGSLSPRAMPRVAPTTTDSLAGQGGKVVAKKEVAAKEDPSTLVALDASRCAVSATQYRRTRVGDDVRCAWSAGGDR